MSNPANVLKQVQAGALTVEQANRLLSSQVFIQLDYKGIPRLVRTGPARCVRHVPL